MKRTLACLALLAMSGFGAQGAADGTSQSVSGGVCQRDDEIAADKRQAIDASAQAFVNAILNSNPHLASQMMVLEASNKAVVLQGMTELSNYLHSTEPYNGAKLEHTYLLETAGSGPEATTVCGPVSGTDWVAVATEPGTTDAYVTISAATVNNDWAFTLSLMREGDAWHISDLEVNPSSIAGHTPDDLLKLAREQRDRGNTLNAQMLYVATHYTVNRGKRFQLGIAQALGEDMSKFKPELEEKDWHAWKMGGAVFNLSHINVTGVAGQLGLSFDLPLEHWKDDKDADQRNRVFLDALRAAHPEYSQAFGFLVARAMRPDGSGGFSTVYDAKRGYLDP